MLQANVSLLQGNKESIKLSQMRSSKEAERIKQTVKVLTKIFWLFQRFTGKI